MKHLMRVCLAVLLCCCLGSCKEDNSPSHTRDELSLETLRKFQILNVSEFGVEPLLNEMDRSSSRLQQEVSQLIDTPDPIHLQSLRDSWLEVSKWLRRFVMVNGHRLATLKMFTEYSEIEAFEAVLQGTDPITQDILGARRNEVPPMNVIEYLIFDEDNYDALALLQADTRRRELLREASIFIRNTIPQLRATWENEKEAFIASTGRGREETYTQLGNRIYYYLRVRKDMVALSLGLFDSPVEVKPPYLEAHRSETSRELLMSGFEQFKKVFYGDFENSPAEYGFDDYLKEFKRQDLLEEINAAIQSIDVALEELGIFEQELVANPEKLHQLKEKFDALYVLFRVDFASATQIPYVQTDCDCD